MPLLRRCSRTCHTSTRRHHQIGTGEQLLVLRRSHADARLKEPDSTRPLSDFPESFPVERATVFRVSSQVISDVNGLDVWLVGGAPPSMTTCIVLLSHRCDALVFDADSSAIVESSLCRLRSSDLSKDSRPLPMKRRTPRVQPMLKEPPKSAVRFLMRCNMSDLRLDCRRIITYHPP